MGNADEDEEHDETPLTPRCGYCRDPLLGRRNGAKYCDRRCKELARERRKRERAQVDMLREKYPLADQSLMELHERATPPRPAGHEDQGDEAGLHYAEDEADAGPGTWSDAWRLSEAVEAVRARYEAQMKPFIGQMKRNPGVRPLGLVRLEQERDREISDLIRAHDHAADIDRARRREPQRIIEAHERQRERAALQAFAHDLPGGSRRYEAPQYTGRATGDIWRW